MKVVLSTLSQNYHLSVTTATYRINLMALAKSINRLDVYNLITPISLNSTILLSYLVNDKNIC